MRKHRRVWLALLSLAALAALVWLIIPAREPEPVYQGKPLRYWLPPAQPEPVYQGKPLRYWVAKTASQGQTASDLIQADQAVRHIGTNAIPTLLEMLQEKDSTLKLKWIALLKKQHFIQPPQPAWLHNYQAVQAFEVLGPTASNAVSALVQVYRMKISQISQEDTLWALHGLGPSVLPTATPVLLNAITNSDRLLSAIAAETIGQIHGQPEVFVPALINATKDSNLDIRFNAVYALGEYGSAAKPAVPTLISALNDADPSVRASATNALKQIDPIAAANAGIK